MCSIPILDTQRYISHPVLFCCTTLKEVKVGGLPLAELNHLELQFLILNDFRLSVPVEELEAYGTMLVQFYAREAVANADLRGIGLPSTIVGGAVAA